MPADMIAPRRWAGNMAVRPHELVVDMVAPRIEAVAAGMVWRLQYVVADCFCSIGPHASANRPSILLLDYAGLQQDRSMENYLSEAVDPDEAA